MLRNVARPRVVLGSSRSLLRAVILPAKLSHTNRYYSTTPPAGGARDPKLVRNAVLALTALGGAAVSHFYPEVLGLSSGGEGEAGKGGEGGKGESTSKTL